LARRRAATPQLRRALTALCLLLAGQGVVGFVQYETGLPSEIVWVHVALATCTWLAVLWSVASAGRLAPARALAPRLAEEPGRVDRGDLPRGADEQRRRVPGAGDHQLQPAAEDRREPDAHRRQQLRALGREHRLVEPREDARGGGLVLRGGAHGVPGKRGDR